MWYRNLATPNVTTYCKASIISKVQCWCMDKYTDNKNRKSRNRTTYIRKLIYDKGGEFNEREELNFLKK